MDSVVRDELRMLRARAYGPSPDIEGDPTALHRLHALEAEERAAQAAEVVPAGPHETPAAAPGTPPAQPPLPPLTAMAASRLAAARLTAPVVVAAGAPPASAAPVVVAAGAPPTSAAPARMPPRRWFLSRGLGMLWVASLVAVAAIATGTTFAAGWIAPIAVHVESRQIATLTPEPGFIWPDQLFGSAQSGALGFSFRGVTIMRAPRGMVSFGVDAPCLIAVATAHLQDEGAGIDGPIYSGCGAGSFPATLQFLIDPSSPAELRSTLPVGSAVQFVLDGDRLGVFSDAR
jgi:hypothetical protein